MVLVYVRSTASVYLRPCGIGGRVGLMLEPGLVTGAAEYLLNWAGVLSCREDGMCRTGKHQEKRSCMLLVPWYTKKISLEFLNHKRSAKNTIQRLSRRPDISCTQLDRINLCRFAQWPELFGRRSITRVRRGSKGSTTVVYLFILILSIFI